MRRLRWLSMMLVVAALAGCSAPGRGAPATEAPGRVSSTAAPAQPAAERAAPALVPMRFALNTPGAVAAPAWVAKDEGFFAKYGIDAEMVPTGGGERLVAALLSGEIPLCVLSGTALVTATLGGADLAFFGSFSNHLRYWLYARPENQSVQDLRGKLLATTTRGGINRRALELALQRGGLDPERDVTMISMAQSGDTLVSLLNGAVAATVLSPPAVFRAEDEGMRMLVDITEYHYPAVLMGIAGGRAWVAQNEELTRGTLQALAEAVVFTHRDKERTKQVIARWTQSDDAVMMERTYNALLAGWERDFHVPAEALRTELDALAVDLPVARDARPEQFYDNRFVDELERGGFFQRL
jgi:ABC-type nitrate/sulfonate/bicarbonate transport system substrate-binding protein